MSKKNPSLSVHYGRDNQLIMVVFKKNQQECFIHIEINQKTGTLTMLPFGGEFRDLPFKTIHLNGTEEIAEKMHMIMEEFYDNMPADIQAELNDVHNMAYRVIDNINYVSLKN